MLRLLIWVVSRNKFITHIEPWRDMITSIIFSRRCLNSGSYASHASSSIKLGLVWESTRLRRNRPGPGLPTASRMFVHDGSKSA
ncbi:hypothetical protein CPLU01_13078 [Colletotrichum plurivorum]|uniref:Uncharacterized protein n=1 Tax=Colletotrichum plurivorum TaxID=2175906 RepID=A0A8H6N4M5_9PEZI|nr:hypothetical protein CPLU01_13078 [Colletotrichum plurivorum]